MDSRVDQRRSESQKAHLWNAAKPVSTSGDGGTSDSMSSSAGSKRGQPSPGAPVRANVVHALTIASDSCSWPASRGGAGTVAGRLKRYWISDACAAPYGKLTGGRK